MSLKGEGTSAPPKHYNFIGFNVGDGATFHFNNPANYLQFPSANSKANFAVCPSDIYVAGDYVPTLLWQTADSTKNKTCADVKIKAVF